MDMIITIRSHGRRNGRESVLTFVALNLLTGRTFDAMKILDFGQLKHTSQSSTTKIELVICDYSMPIPNPTSNDG
jgi:hypothetical protein